jgi:hypothetical protein
VADSREGGCRGVGGGLQVGEWQGGTLNVKPSNLEHGSARAKKGGRGGSDPSPKGEEDPVEGCSNVVVTPHNHNYHRFLGRMVFACDHRVKRPEENCEDLPVSERGYGGAAGDMDRKDPVDTMDGMDGARRWCGVRM